MNGLALRRMRRWIAMGRVLLVGLLAVGAYLWLAPRELGWVLLPAAGTVFGLWITLRWVSRSRRRSEEARENRWADALIHAEERAQTRAEVEALRDSKRGKPAHFARLSLLVGEFWSADGEAERAREVVEAIPIDRLSASVRASVLIAKATAALECGDVAGAERWLTKVDVGRDSERRFEREIVRGFVSIERGETEAALAKAEALRTEAMDESAQAECRFLKAAALDAAGDREDALRVMRGLDPDLLMVIAVVGMRRVRELAAAAGGASAVTVAEAE